MEIFLKEPKKRRALAYGHKIQCSQRKLEEAREREALLEQSAPNIMDLTFEPSIDMMVNDFDDEQTLIEEEALAELEAQDPTDEVETLQKESEIPLEELLVNYRQHVEEDYEKKRRKRKKSAKKNKRKATKSSGTETSSSKHCQTVENDIPGFTALPLTDEVIVIDESEDELEMLKTEETDTDAAEDENELGSYAEEGDDEDEEEAEFDDSSYNSDGHTTQNTKLTALAFLYHEDYENIQQKMDDECSDEDDDDYVKKTIMVGSAYQATIPVGLSKYGDVLPYENEDKLIWEPSQVSEQEVEEYLLRVKELKISPNLLANEDYPSSSSASVTSESDQGLGSNTIKDDEQALHLLVQCGYNFKEALRRKRLNAVPLTGSMSLWSEEECRNFEEGIQKYGKDFRKIRETQVRTRSIRELVQFYYLWKKTERRDQDFVDSDTIDYMDVYLDYDERDTGPNAGPLNLSCNFPNDAYLTNQDPPSKKHHRKFSIMNERKRSSAGNHTLKSNLKKTSSNKKYRRRSTLLCGKKIKHHHDNIDGSGTSTKKPNPDTSSGKSNRNNSLSTSASVINAKASSLTINIAMANHSHKK